jgi:hypothetical protein
MLRKGKRNMIRVALCVILTCVCESGKVGVV